MFFLLPTAVGGSLLCYEGLAELHAFARDTEKARATFEEGATRCRRPTSRYLRQWAVFERKANNVGAAASLFGAAVRSNPQVGGAAGDLHALASCSGIKAVHGDQCSVFQLFKGFESSLAESQPINFLPLKHISVFRS